MAMAGYKTIDGYIATFPEEVQVILETIRQTVQKAVPEAEETISYQMPAFKHHGTLLYFAGWKNHFAIYPAALTIIDFFKSELARYEVSKGTIKFPLDKPVPVALIRKIALFRAKENIERKKAKTSAKKATKR